MQIKVAPVDIPADNPFCNDCFQRKEEAQNLTTLILRTATPMVLAVEGGWGTGKTTFVQMWQARLQAEGHATVYFNAWANDFAQDPLIAFISEMDQALPPGIRKYRHWKRVCATTQRLAQRLVPAAARIVTAGVLDLDKEQEKILATLAGDMSGDALNAFVQTRTEIGSFKKNMNGLVDQWIKTPGRPAGPIVVFVDELDRCKPTYALALLERLKHILDIPGFVFVLSMDKHQLKHQVSAIYGQGIDAEKYLERFIDLEYTLRRLSVKDYLKALARRYGNQQTNHLIAQVITDLTVSLPVSLRTAEQTYVRTFLATRHTPDDDTMLIAIMVALKTLAPELFLQIVEGAIDTGTLERIQALRHRNHVSDPACRLEGFVLALAMMGKSPQISGRKQFHASDPNDVSAREFLDKYRRTAGQKLEEIMACTRFAFSFKTHAD